MKINPKISILKAMKTGYAGEAVESIEYRFIFSSVGLIEKEKFFIIHYFN